jgi:excinuclease ABC subunit B
MTPEAALVARLQKRVVNDVYMLRETGSCSGLENYSRHLTGRQPGQAPDTLLDYFSTRFENDWLLIMDESHVTLPQLSAMYLGDQARKKSLVKHGYRLPSALDNRPLTVDEFWQQVPQTLFCSATPGKYELKRLSLQQEPIDMVIRPTHVCDPIIQVRSPTLTTQNDDKKNHHPLQDLANEIRQRVERQERTLVVTLTKRDAEDLATYLNTNHQDMGMEVTAINATYLHSGLSTDERSNRLRLLQSGQVDVLVGVNCLREGLDLPQVSLVAVLNADSEYVQNFVYFSSVQWELNHVPLFLNVN